MVERDLWGVGGGIGWSGLSRSKRLATRSSQFKPARLAACKRGAAEPDYPPTHREDSLHFLKLYFLDRAKLSGTLRRTHQASIIPTATVATPAL